MQNRLASTVAGPPRFHGASHIGVRPRHPLFVRIAFTGEPPVQLEFQGLPAGVRFDPETHCLCGLLEMPGRYSFLAKGVNNCGTAERKYTLTVGEQLSYAPPMGWNSWNCFGLEVTAGRVLANAHALVETGLADLGWTYVNIDGGWEGETRSGSGAIQPNPDTFPEMAELVQAIHGLGLKAGIYSTPWVRSFGGQIGCSAGPGRAHIRDEAQGWFVGEHTFEDANARQWAEWGFDYLKYDWNPMDLASGRRMSTALRRCGRDIFFNPCNSMRDESPQAWAQIADAFYLWRRREAGDRDLEDTWESIDSIGFRMSPWRAVASSGHWNDPDMLALGPVGWGTPRPNRLNQDEQRTHFALWALLAGPLLIGGDLTGIDQPTLELLGNAELIALHQDSLGRAGARVWSDEGCEGWAKELEDGGLALGFFNRDSRPQNITFGFGENGLPPSCSVYNLFSQEKYRNQDAIEAKIPAHGCEVFRLRASTPVPGSWIDARTDTGLESSNLAARF